MNGLNEILIEVLFVLSGLFMLLGTIGLFRFRDFFLRIHSATLVNVGGVMLSLLLFAIKETHGVMRFKILFLVFVLLTTVPVSTHFIALAAYKRGVKMNINKRVKVS